MPKMIAVRDCDVGGRTHVVGDRFDATPAEAAAHLYKKTARVAKEEDQVSPEPPRQEPPPPPPTPPPTTPKPKRHYRRRDMTAEK